MAQKRMHKQRRATARDVSRRLTAYSKAATAVLALGGGAALSLPDSSEAAVVTGAINKTIQASGLGFGFIKSSSFDLDQDGTEDVRFTHVQVMTTTSTTTTSAGTFQGVRCATVSALNGSVAVTTSTSYASALTASANVSGSIGTSSSGKLGVAEVAGTWSGTPPSAFHYSITTTSQVYGDFPGQGPKCVGLTFEDTKGCMHYGWVRVEVPADVSYVKVLDYAYETECGTPIHVEPPAAPEPVGGVVHDVSDAAAQKENN